MCMKASFKSLLFLSAKSTTLFKFSSSKSFHQFFVIELLFSFPRIRLQAYYQCYSLLREYLIGLKEQAEIKRVKLAIALIEIILFMNLTSFLSSHS